jgi:hypothetical protein
MIDSMPSHAQSWVAFVQNHGIQIDVPDLMRRTTGRTGAECMRELFQRDMSDEEAWTAHCRKGAALPRAVCAHLCRGGGLQGVCRPDARTRAQDRGRDGGRPPQYCLCDAAPASCPCRPTPSPAATKGWPANLNPPYFWKWPGAWLCRRSAALCLKTHPLASKRQAPRWHACRGHLHQPQRRTTCPDPTCWLAARNYLELIESNFLETLDVAPA